MQGTVFALFGAALAAGVAELLLPRESGGTSKLFRFLVSLVVLLLVLAPFLGFLQKSEDLIHGDIKLEEESEANFDRIFSDAVQQQGKAEFEERLYTFLEAQYGLVRKDVALLIRFDAEGALASVSVYLSGAGLLQDPTALEADLSKKLGCRVEVR